MRITNEFLCVIFKHVFPQQILDGKLWYDRIDVENFKCIMRPYIQRYSETELENMYEFLQEKTKGRGFNIFWMLLYCSELMLTIQENTFKCHYNKLMRWRMSTFHLGEELFTTSYAAKNCTPSEMKRIGFDWKFVLGHDNFHLNKLLKNGLAENHFHLYGSAPVFPVSWVSMMNDFYNENYERNLQIIDKKRRSIHVSYSINYREFPLRILCRQAGLIRLFLYAWLTQEEIPIGSYLMQDEEVIHYINPDNHSRNLLDLRGKMDEDIFRELFWERTQKNVQRLLCDPEWIDEYRRDIQSGITCLKKYSDIDYALHGLDQLQMGWGQGGTFFYSGERWFMYEMFRRIYLSEDAGNNSIYNLFYAYIVMKNRLFEELVQVNEFIGFENFQIYQKRKAAFRSRTLYEESIRQAVSDCVINHQLALLEARITPSDSADKYAKCISELDRIVDPEKENRGNYFYVIHFLKQKDIDIRNEIKAECRHWKLRKKIEKQAKALALFRKKYPQFAIRVLGIDAAGQELGCRPETFATVFRFLHQDIGGKDLEDMPKLPQLRMTFHVGEEFLDIVDGLRAIDEAVHFLNLQCGDRLGHALALGMKPSVWYGRKKNNLILSQQDYLDNLVWLYEQTIGLKLQENDGLKEWIEGEFDTMFRKIYLSNMNPKELDAIMDGYMSYNKKNQNIHAVKNLPSQFVFDIHTYYKAWGIRGDDPERYQMGYYEELTGLEDEYARAGVNFAWPKDYKRRFIPEVGIINYYYHFHPEVKKEGSKILKFHVSPMYIHAVEQIQEKMQKWIGRKWIGIETNPSSNFKIASLERYDEHPITNFYNKGLTVDQNDLKKCPQLNVSINTDDQGVFATSLENEYSLMSYALEHKCDDQGNPMYAREMIYDWLTNVKQMGNRQSFGENTEFCSIDQAETEDDKNRKMGAEVL